MAWVSPKRIGQITRGTFDVKPGSLFPALHRLEQEGFIRGEWASTPEGYRAKYYRLTAAGQRQLNAERRTGLALPRPLRKCLKLTDGDPVGGAS